jgi:dipeptidyl aminopeptidase/acylaminoacyl peptidase
MSIAEVRRAALALTFLAAFAPVVLNPLIAQSAAPPLQAPASGATAVAASNGGKPIAIEDYARFKRIAGATLSSDGKWMAYTVTPNDGDGALTIQSLDTPAKHVIPRGTGAAFSPSARHVAYFINPPAGRGRGAGRGTAAPAGGAPAAPAARAFELFDLASGVKTSLPAVASFSFSPDGEWLIVRPQGATPAPAETGRGRGAAEPATPAAPTGPAGDLLLRNLSNGQQRYIANVDTFSFDQSGALLGYLVRGQNRLGNGVYMMTLKTGEQAMLEGANADYAQLVWSPRGAHLAALRGDKARDKVHRDNVLVAWTNLDSGTGWKAVTIDPAKIGGFPAGMVISEFAAPAWNTDGTRLLVGLKAQEPELTASTEPKANVDVWHWKDPDPQSVQIVRLNQDRRAVLSAVVDLAAGSVRQIADDDMRSVDPARDLRWGIGRIDKPYRGQIAWGGNKVDLVRVDLSTGARTPIETGLSRTMGISPDGKWFLYLYKGRVHSYELATGKKTAIDGGRNFVNVEDDHDYEKPIYGVAGYTSDGKSVLLYDRYDVWAVPLAGGSQPQNLTRGLGAKQEIRFRIARLDPPGLRPTGPEGQLIDLAQPISLSAYGEFTKKSGYFSMAPGQPPVPLIWVDKAVGAPIVANKAPRMIFTQQTFREYPNYWIADTRFNDARQVTDADPELLKEFAWGSKTLVDYTNSKGQKLQATLTLPAGYEPGRRYPMIVYFYEIMSNTHHSFQIPPYDDRPHMSTYASNGYLVLQPDVVYEIGKPGSSALDCVGSAVKKVIELGYADPRRIGLQGHSWGGYQSSFILTQTDMFAAVVTGAPPTNLVSFYGTLYRSSGTIQQGITEVGQVRMGTNVTPWTHHELYESQSPVHHVTNIKTPFLILHGTADGAVDWGQGLEFYAAARRNGKSVILLSYPDEAHHLGRRENQVDFQVRMRQFFDHYLKSVPAPDWMVNGVPAIRK